MRQVIPRIVVILVALFSTAIVVMAQQGNIPPANPNCSPYGGVAPAGQQFPTTIEPDQPIWCYTQPQAGAPTRLSGANDWVDDWTNDGPAIQTLRNGEYDYQRFDYTSEGRIVVGQFINVNHWMPDIADASTFNLSGGSQLSPNRAFHAENGKLVLEVDGAAGSDGMGGADAFYELDLAGSRPTGITVDTLYGYGQFGGQGAIGCRLERQADGGHVVCAMYDNSTRDAGGTDVNGGPSGVPGRVWEIQGAGTELCGCEVAGGYPQYQIPGTNLHVSDVWRMCGDNELDLHCRDRFRIEFTQTSLDLYVNGYPVYYIHGLTSNNSRGQDARIPAAWLNNSYVYATSWINSGIHHATRWHWDGVMVNRHNPDGSFHAPDAYSSFCLGQPNNTCPDPVIGGTTPTATPTPDAGISKATPTVATTSTPAPTASIIPSVTPSPSPTSTAVPTATPKPGSCRVSVEINGTPRPYRPC